MKKILLLFVLFSFVASAQIVRQPMLNDSLAQIRSELADTAGALRGEITSGGTDSATVSSLISDTATVIRSEIPDTTSLSNRIDLKLNITDTTGFYSAFYQAPTDTASLSNRINANQDSVDTKLYTSFDTEYPNVPDPSTDNYIPVMTGTGIRYSDLNSLPISSDVQTALNAKMNAADFGDSLATHIEGDTTIATAGTLDSLATDYWNGDLVNKQDTLAYHWGVMDTVTSGGLIGYKVESNITVVKVSAYAVTDSVWFNIQERGAATPNTAGDSLFASGMWASLTGKDSTSFSGSSGANFAKDNWIIPFINTYATDAERFGITVWYIKQDY